MFANGNLLDEVDHRILDLLQADPRMSNKLIAQATELSETTIGNRLMRLSTQNIARVIGQAHFRTRGWTTTALLDVTVSPGAAEEVIERLSALPNVITIYEMAGPPNLILKVAACDLPNLTNLAMGTIGQIPGVERIDVNLSLAGGHTRAGFGNLDAPHEDPPETGELQDRILAMLARDGRISNREMARGLGVAEVTVRNRTRAMVENKLLRYMLVRNPDKAGFHALGFARFSVAPRDFHQAIQDLFAMPNVFGASLHTGAQNLLVSIYGRDWPETHALFDSMCNRLPLLDPPVLRPAKRFARHRFELALID